jgi:hypothetical protein
MATNRKIEILKKKHPSILFATLLELSFRHHSIFIFFKCGNNKTWKHLFAVIFRKHFTAVVFFYRKNISCRESIFWAGSPQAINPSTLDLCSWVTPVGLWHIVFISPIFWFHKNCIFFVWMNHFILPCSTKYF